MSMAKIITVETTADKIGETTYYELGGAMVTITGEPYIRRVDEEEHFEQLLYKMSDFFRKLFNEVEKAISHCKSHKMEDFVVWYEFVKKALALYNICEEEGTDELPLVPELLIDYVNYFSFMEWRIKNGKILSMGV